MRNKIEYKAFFNGEAKTSVELAEYLNIPHKKMFTKIKKNASAWEEKFGLEENELISITGDDFYLLSPIQTLIIAGELDAKTFVDTMTNFPGGIMGLINKMRLKITPED